MTGQASITITFDPDMLQGYSDEYLAALWHVAQWNPAPHDSGSAGEVASKIGFEIIRRWLAKAPVEMYRHQGRDHYWAALREFATYQPPEGVTGGPEWYEGKWVLKEQQGGEGE